MQCLHRNSADSAVDVWPQRNWLFVGDRVSLARINSVSSNIIQNIHENSIISWQILTSCKGRPCQKLLLFIFTFSLPTPSQSLQCQNNCLAGSPIFLIVILSTFPRSMTTDQFFEHVYFKCVIVNSNIFLLQINQFTFNWRVDYCIISCTWRGFNLALIRRSFRGNVTNKG